MYIRPISIPRRIRKVRIPMQQARLEELTHILKDEKTWLTKVRYGSSTCNDWLADLVKYPDNAPLATQIQAIRQLSKVNRQSVAIMNKLRSLVTVDLLTKKPAHIWKELLPHICIPNQNMFRVYIGRLRNEML